MIALTIDITTTEVTGWKKGIPDPLTRKFGTTQEVGIIFEKDGQPYELLPGNSGDVIVKARRGDGLLAASAGWTTATWGDRTIYLTSLSLNTDELDTATAGNTRRVPAKLEVSWTEPDKDERSATVNFLVIPRERLGTEGPTSPASPPYPSASIVNQLVIDVGNKQPLDSDLTAIALLATTSYGRAFLTLANQAALVALLPSYQPLDSDLSAIAALGTTAFGRSLLELANAAALRSAAGLGPTANPTFDNLSVTDLNVGADAHVGASLAADGDISFGGSINMVTAAELSHLAGVTSAIQTQLDNLQPLDSDLTAIAALATTSFGRALLTMADAAALRVVAGLGPSDHPTWEWVTAEGAAPRVRISETDQGTDGKLWDIVAASGSLLFRALVDSGLSGATWLTVVRSGATVTSIAAGAPVRLKSYTVATLPTGTEGDMAFVTDATAPTYLGALTGGGTVKVPVYFADAAWLSH